MRKLLVVCLAGFTLYAVVSNLIDPYEPDYAPQSICISCPDYVP